MRKFISVAIALLMVAAMLSSGALAENGKEHKGGVGAGKGQNQNQAAEGNEDKGNSHGQGHTLDKTKADDTGIETYDNDDENEDDDENTGKVEEDLDDDADDNGGKGEPAGQVKKDHNENKPDEKTQEGPNHGNAYGRVRNTQEVLNDIGLLAGTETAAQLNTLMTAYHEAKDAVTAKTALAALLDALTQACTVTATDGNGETTDTQDQLALLELAKLREKVLANAGNDNGTLLALMHAYENALRVMNHLEPITDPDEETGTGTGTETDTETETDTDSAPDAAPGI